MPNFNYSKALDRYVWEGSFLDRHIPKEAGWKWDEGRKHWYAEPDQLRDIMVISEYARGDAKFSIRSIADEIADSYAIKPHENDNVTFFDSLVRDDGEKMFPFQVAGAKELLYRKRAILADDMGLGKTVQAIAAAMHEWEYEYQTTGERHRIVVICPTSVTHQWAREIDRWTGMSAQICTGRKPDVSLLDKAPWIVIGYGVAKEWAPSVQSCQTLIIDEAHYLKTEESQRTQAILGGPDKAGLADRSCNVYMLTGTPHPNRSIELQTLVGYGCREGWARGGGYLYRYCDPRNDGYGQTFKGSTNGHELALRLRSTCMIRRTKPQVYGQMPRFVRDTVWLEPDAAMKATLKPLTPEEIQALIEAVELGDEAAFQQVSEVRRIQAEAKTPLAIDWIRKRYFDDELDWNIPVVIACHHRELAKRVAEDLGVVPYIGSTSTKARQRIVDDFAAGRTNCVVGSIKSVGTGVDGLQNRCSQMVAMEESWVPGENKQLEGRLLRFGQKSPVNITYLLVEGTYDATVHRTIHRKMKATDEVLQDIRTFGKSMPDQLAQCIAKLGTKASVP